LHGPWRMHIRGWKSSSGNYDLTTIAEVSL
jgi:hypothetical protein